jgi:hypothetical protein
VAVEGDADGPQVSGAEAADAGSPVISSRAKPRGKDNRRWEQGVDLGQSGKLGCGSRPFRQEGGDLA